MKEWLEKYKACRKFRQQIKSFEFCNDIDQNRYLLVRSYHDQLVVKMYIDALVNYFKLELVMNDKCVRNMKSPSDYFSDLEIHQNLFQYPLIFLHKKRSNTQNIMYINFVTKLYSRSVDPRKLCVGVKYYIVHMYSMPYYTYGSIILRAYCAYIYIKRIAL